MIREDELRITYDVESMPEDGRREMEKEILAVLKNHGWAFSSSGANMKRFRVSECRERHLVMEISHRSKQRGRVMV